MTTRKGHHLDDGFQYIDPRWPLEREDDEDPGQHYLFGVLLSEDDAVLVGLEDMPVGPEYQHPQDPGEEDVDQAYERRHDK